MSGELPPIDVLKKLLGREPKTEFEQRDLDLARRITGNPAGVPLHRTKVDADRPVEAGGDDVHGLSDDRAWFFLGFAYEFIRIDVDLFAVFCAAGGLSRDVQSVVVKDRFIERKDGRDTPLMHIVQGIPKDLGRRFIDFIATYQWPVPARVVAGKTAPAQMMACGFQEVRIADPTLEYRRATEVWFALPVNLTARFHLTMVKAPGFLLERPVFGVQRMPPEVPNVRTA